MRGRQGRWAAVACMAVAAALSATSVDSHAARAAPPRCVWGKLPEVLPLTGVAFVGVGCAAPELVVTSTAAELTWSVDKDGLFHWRLPTDADGATLTIGPAHPSLARFTSTVTVTNAWRSEGPMTQRQPVSVVLDANDDDRSQQRIATFSLSGGPAALRLRWFGGSTVVPVDRRGQATLMGEGPAWPRVGRDVSLTAIGWDGSTTELGAPIAWRWTPAVSRQSLPLRLWIFVLALVIIPLVLLFVGERKPGSSLPIAKARPPRHGDGGSS